MAISTWPGQSHIENCAKSSIRHSCTALSFLHRPVIPAPPCHSCEGDCAKTQRSSFLRKQEPSKTVEPRKGFLHSLNSAITTNITMRPLHLCPAGIMQKIIGSGTLETVQKPNIRRSCESRNPVKQPNPQGFLAQSRRQESSKTPKPARVFHQ